MSQNGFQLLGSIVKFLKKGGVGIGDWWGELANVGASFCANHCEGIFPIIHFIFILRFQFKSILCSKGFCENQFLGK